jgi:hypothetical protein
MKELIMFAKFIKITVVFCFTIMFSEAHATQCFVLYKAKKNNPLKLHLGLMQINETCTMKDIGTKINNRLNSNGWTLLQIVKANENVKIEKMKRDLGEYFLKY